MLDLLESVLTSCPHHLRVMGYVDELIGIDSRYRRCRDDWQPHLDRTKDVIRQAIAQCPSRRKVVVFGSGRLLDVPLEELAASFERVALVDVVHPLPVRRLCKKLSNVELASADVTGVSEQVFAVGNQGGPLPQSNPTIYLDDPQVDLVVSVNLLSQLPYSPIKYLRRWNHYSSRDLETFAQHLIEAHLAFLAKFRATICLVCDQEYLTYDEQEKLIETRGALHGIQLPWPGAEWIWRLAPRHERGQTSLFHKVRGAIHPRPDPIDFALVL